MKRFIILTLTVAGALHAQTSSPDKDRDSKPQHRTKMEAKLPVKSCQSGIALFS